VCLTQAWPNFSSGTVGGGATQGCDSEIQGSVFINKMIRLKYSITVEILEIR